MNQDRHKRKMSAIFSADVVGYSRLMEEDESWAIKNIEENKSLISELIRDYHGRVVDAPGDNILAEFSSITNAVECAVKVQQELKKKNANIVENRRMEFRIGINLGEIVEEGERIYGSGVNIAARIEGLSDSGGICISGRTFDHIRSTFDFGYEYLGEHNVKNISEPIRVYRLLMETKDVGKVLGEKKAPSRSSYRMAIATVIILIIIVAGLLYWNPSTEDPRDSSKVEEAPKTIAVLPFENLSSDAEQEYFSDGLTEELINKLAQVKDLQVIGRTSSFHYKDKNIDPRKIGETLGVIYLLEGSVRKSENKVRITAQLIKAADSYHLFSKNYDRELKDIFDIQDNIAQSVADALQITLGVGELGNTPGMTRDIDAYDAYLAGRSLRSKSGRDNYILAIEQLEQSVTLDPDFAFSWYYLSDVYHSAAVTWLPQRAEEFSAKRKAALSRVIELAPDTDFALRIAASQSGDRTEIERLLKKALELYPANYDTNSEYGWFLIDVGRPMDAFDYFKRLERLEPLSSGSYLGLAHAYELNGDNDASAIKFKRAGELSEQPTLYNSALLVLALEENNKALIEKYITLVVDTELLGNINRSNTRDINQVMNTLLDTPEKAGSELKLFLADPAYNNPMNLTGVAVWASYFGEFEIALQACRKSIKSSSDINFTMWRPIHKGMRRLPGFKDLVRKIGLVDYWRATGNWGDFCRPVGEDDFVCE